VSLCVFSAARLIEALIEVYPDGPKMKDDQGMLPIHLACRNGASKGVVLTLTAFPESFGVQDRKGRVPADPGIEFFCQQGLSCNLLSAFRRYDEPYPMQLTPTSSRGFGGASVASTAMSRSVAAAHLLVLLVNWWS
jgi:hypothetical protein